MSKIFLFGIGGTGARVLRSLTMMLATGVKLGVDEIIPIIIDPDAANADLTRTVSLLNNYSAIREKLQFSTDNKIDSFVQKLNESCQITLFVSMIRMINHFNNLLNMLQCPSPIRP